ncbi:MAG: hypothetical protein OEV15_09030 [Gallionella sp.]|nr:hypothetical protein [Gallionella sp.]
MLTPPLEPTVDRANPKFKDVASCEKWLAQLQMTNLQQAHSMLLTEINEFNRYAMGELVRLNTLEFLRETIDYVQGEYAKKLVGKPLPLNEHELLTFLSSVQLWQAMSLGYQRCLQSLIEGDKQLAKRKALLCHRSMLYNGKAIFQYLRTGYEFEGKLWQQLHGLYVYAESEGLLFEKVPDAFNKFQPKDTCQQAFLRILLISHAHPAELSRAQMNLLDSWLQHFIGMLAIDRRYTASKGDAPPLAFDLGGSQHGLQLARMTKPGESMRYLAMVPLSKSIRVKTILLQQGKTPRQVELGDIGNNRECIELLTFLHQCWCEDPDMRFVPHKQSGQRIELCYSFKNIYAQMTGGGVKQPTKSAESDHASRKQIETFGRVLQDSPNRKQAETLPSLEIWNIDSETIQGAQLTREGTLGGQLIQRQILALRHDDTGVFVLGVAASVKVIRTGQLRIGMRYLPGKVEAVTLRAVGTEIAELDKPAAAFLLHVIPELKIPPSLIIPHNWFKPERLLEMSSGNGDKQNIKVGFSVEHGGDFERVSFTSD